MPRFISSTPSASAGNRWPPVPPAASRIRGRVMGPVLNQTPHPEERRLRRVSKDGHTFMVRDARKSALLTMRSADVGWAKARFRAVPTILLPDLAREWWARRFAPLPTLRLTARSGVAAHRVGVADG